MGGGEWMAMPVVLYPDPILREVIPPGVGLIEASILGEQMLESLSWYSAVALAAPQVGRRVRVVALGGSVVRGGLVLVDPRFEPQVDGGEDVQEERCVSLPGVCVRVKRWWRGTVRWRDVDGMGEREVKLEGYHARVVQHELDHVDGILIIDRCGPAEVARNRKPLKKLDGGRK